MKKFALLIVLGATLTLAQAFGQNLAKENRIAIEKKNRGYLGNVIVNEERKQIDMVFVTKEKTKKIKFHVYQFDYDLNLVNEFSDEQELEKARGKYKWFKHKGGEDEVTYQGVTVTGNLTGQTVFQQKEIIRKFSWATGNYKYKTKMGEKLKPKSEDGKKLFFYAGLDLDETGEALALMGLRGKGMKELGKEMYHYRVIKVNKDLDITSQEDMVFDYMAYPIYKSTITSGESEGDWVFVFAPFKAGGYKKIADDPTQYIYARVGRDGKVKDRITFSTKAHSWKITGAYEKNGQVLLYGPGKTKKLEKTYMKMGENPQVLEKGFETFQIISIKDGKVDFITTNPLEDFATKALKPEGQKKVRIYDGKKVEVRGLDFLSSGEFIINAQDWATDARGHGNVYKSVFVFHFDKEGKLISSYGIDNPQEGWGSGAAGVRGIPMDAATFEGTDGKFYWLSIFPKSIFTWTETDGNYKYTYSQPRYAGFFGQIDPEAKKANFSLLGGDDVYLYNKYPWVSIENGTKRVFLGFVGNRKGGDKGREFWLGKFDPAQY